MCSSRLCTGVGGLVDREATDVRALRKYMGVAELVRRDKANHRLGLNRVDDLPREVLNVRQGRPLGSTHAT